MPDLPLGRQGEGQVIRLEADGSVSEHKILCLRYSFDDRIADGTYMGKTLELMRRLIEEPEPLAERPELGPSAWRS